MDTAGLQFILDDLFASLSDAVFCSVFSSMRNLFIYASRPDAHGGDHATHLSSTGPTLNALIEDVIASNLLSTMEMIAVRFRDGRNVLEDFVLIAPIDDITFFLIYYERTVLNNGPVIISHALKEIRTVLEADSGSHKST